MYDEQTAMVDSHCREPKARMQEKDMRDSQTPAALNAALRFVLADEMPAQHKAVLIEVLTQALRNQESAHLREQAAEQAGGEWQADEVLQLESFLKGKVATSWQHADELAMHLAVLLHRDPKSVRTKADELGLGASVDYRSARAFVQRRDQ
jgi:hypothetical protein